MAAHPVLVCCWGNPCCMASDLFLGNLLVLIAFCFLPSVLLGCVATSQRWDEACLCEQSCDGCGTYLPAVGRLEKALNPPLPIKHPGQLAQIVEQEVRWNLRKRVGAEAVRHAAGPNISIAPSEDVRVRIADDEGLAGRNA